MKAKTRIIIACILIPVISLAVTLIIVRAGIHKVKKLAMPEITTEAEETFKGKPVEMSTEEIVALYNEAFNNTAKSEKIVSNGHFLVDRDKSSWTNMLSKKYSEVGINLLCSILDYSDYEMNGDSSASLTAEDVLYASANENNKSIELKIKIKECDYKFESLPEELPIIRDIPITRTGFGATDIATVFEAYGEKADFQILNYPNDGGEFISRDDYTKYGPVSLNCIIDKNNNTIIKCKLNYDVFISADFFGTEGDENSIGSSYMDVKLYLNANFTYPYKAAMPIKNRTTAAR